MRAARSSPPSGWPSTSCSGCPAWPRSPRATCRAVAGTGARILDTRKTTPGLRVLEKQAVLAGGGHNHRAGLFDAILVKENHSAMAGGVGEATARALAAAAAAGGGGVRDARRGARGARRGRAADPARQHDERPAARGGGAHRRPRRARGVGRRHARHRARRSRRPASTSSASARSRTRRRRST